MTERLNIHAYYMILAFAAAARGTCPRRKVGAILTKDGEAVATGYNGSPPKMPHCDEVGCLLSEGRCIRTIHAEMNALLRGRQGDTLYCTDQPCLACLKAALSAGVRRIFYARPYPDLARDLFVEAHGLENVIAQMLVPIEHAYNIFEKDNQCFQ